MKKCPFCDADIEDSARFCLYCMRPLAEKDQLPPHKKKKPHYARIIATAAISLLLLIAVRFGSQIRLGQETPTDMESGTGAAHIPATMTVENFIDSSCTETGSYDEVIYCSECHEELFRTKRTVDKKPHVYDQQVSASEYLKTAADCYRAAVYHYSCICGAKGDTTFTDEKESGHNWGEWVLIKEATLTEEGVMERVCPCGQKETKTVEKLLPELAYDLNDDGQSYSVTGKGTWTDPVIVIPAEHRGLPVTGIAESAFLDCEELTGVTISPSITAIGSYAFNGCTNLKDVYVSDVKAWLSISFGDSYTSHPNYYGRLHLLDENGEEITDLVIPGNIRTIDIRAFQGCSSLVSVTFHNKVTAINGWAFEGCSRLASITIPVGVTFIGSSAFANCSSLTNITMPNSITNIKTHAFEGCSSLTSITIPSGVVTIDNDMFNGCSSLTSVTIPNSVVNIGDYAFNGCSSLTNITIPSSVVTIGEYAFISCSRLTSINLPSSLAGIGKGAFYNCYNLGSINYGGSGEQWQAINKGTAWDKNTKILFITYNYKDE